MLSSLRSRDAGIRAKLAHQGPPTRWRRYEEWLDLFTDDARYWMPLRKNVRWHDRAAGTSAQDEVGWLDDDKDTRSAELRRKMS